MPGGGFRLFQAGLGPRQIPGLRLGPSDLAIRHRSRPAQDELLRGSLGRVEVSRSGLCCGDPRAEKVVTFSRFTVERFVELLVREMGKSRFGVNQTSTHLFHVSRIQSALAI